MTTATPGSVAESIQTRLVEAVMDRDAEAFGLLLHLAVAQVGTQQAMALTSALPRLVPSCDVPACLQLLHGPEWLAVAREVVFTAGYQLAQAGAQLGRDVSFASKLRGEPVLYMSAELYQAISETSPDSLHLVRSFLVIRAN
jgi:hypothetical protein